MLEFHFTHAHMMGYIYLQKAFAENRENAHRCILQNEAGDVFAIPPSSQEPLLFPHSTDHLVNTDAVIALQQHW